MVRKCHPKDGDPDQSLRSVLLRLHDTMTELEARFPGLAFGEILAGVPEEVDKNDLADKLRSIGVSSADIAIVTGVEKVTGIIEIDRPESQAEAKMFSVADAYRQGGRLSARALATSESGYLRSVQLRTDLTDTQALIAAAILNTSGTIDDVARRLGVARNTVRDTLIKVRYHRSRGLHAWS